MNQGQSSAKTTVETVEAYLKAWNGHDLDALLATLDEDVTVIVPSFPDPLRGKEQLRTLWGTLFNKVSPDVHEEVLTVIAQSDIVACECIETAVFAPESINRPYRIRLGVFFRVNESGLIEELHSYWDTLSMSQQLGKNTGELGYLLQ